MHIAFISNDPPDVPFDNEPLPLTANEEGQKGSSDQPAMNWPDACAAFAHAFIAANLGGPPVLKPVGDGEDAEPLLLPK